MLENEVNKTNKQTNKTTTPTLVRVKKLESLTLDTPNSTTEGIQKNGWPGLEDVDGRFLPNPLDSSTRTANTMIGKIHTRKEVKIIPVQIFPRPNHITKALPDNVKAAQNRSPRLQTIAQVKQPPEKGKKSKQRQYETNCRDERSQR